MDVRHSRRRIYDHFHGSEACQQFFFQGENAERYAGYYTSMYLIQDTSEALLVHRERGFSDSPYIAYIEIWGILQAVFIQQDAIRELYSAVSGRTLDMKRFSKWQEIRELRNICAGHPARKDRPKSTPLARTFMGRRFGDYSRLTYEKWESLDSLSHPEVDLGKLLDEYELEFLTGPGRLFSFFLGIHRGMATMESKSRVIPLLMHETGYIKQ